MRGRVLIIDDDEGIRKVLEYTLGEEGYEVLTAGSAEEGLALVSSRLPHAVITDMKLPAADGLAVLEGVKEISPETAVILVTAFGTIEKAVEAMKKGAFDYLPKPFNRDEVKLTVSKALRLMRLEGENRRLRREVSRAGEEEIIARSPRMTAVLESIRRVAPTDATVLLTGESGTGKEVAARSIHGMSGRKGADFVVVNCAAIPRDLLESELFGHEKGAFTGAMGQKRGKFELADGGTIFLDEIADLAPSLQAKLLRVLQERTVERLGGKGPFPVDVRIIAATNANLKEAMDGGRFREDLYYRLSVVPIHIPPLRERTEDIPALVGHFLALFDPRRTVTLTPAAMEAVQAYPWPGNVRELRNICERLVILRKGDRIDAADLPPEMRSAPPAGGGGRGTTAIPLPAEGLSLAEAEKGLILQALERAHWNQTRAAALLQIPRHVLIYRMDKFGLREKSRGRGA